MDTIFQHNLAILSEAVNTTTPEFLIPVEKCINITKKAITEGHKIMLCGNGGSASTASHITNDFIGHMNNWARKGYPAIALTADISVLTALTNDYGYDQVFSKQVMALGQTGDILWGFSTSGNSENVLQAVHTCKNLGITSVIFTNKSGGTLRKEADIWIPVNTNHNMITEALHLFYIHSIAEAIENELDPL